MEKKLREQRKTVLPEFVQQKIHLEESQPQVEMKLTVEFDKLYYTTIS